VAVAADDEARALADRVGAVPFLRLFDDVLAAL
jgi:hypothetical protein